MRALLKRFWQDQTITPAGLYLVIVMIALAFLGRACGVLPGATVGAGDPGGLISAYAARYAALKASGEHVEVVGDCFSACTMVLSLPRSQVCAQPGARLGFHAGMDLRDPGKPSAVANKLMSAYYPPGVRKWFYAKPGRSLTLTLVPATRFLPKCR